ncbi:MAG: DNA cytosine methyltransferase [Burkholderia sp.]
MAMRHIRTLIDPSTDRQVRRDGRFPPHKQVSYTKVGQNKGSPRLWLEGLRLADCGFAPGSRFRVELDIANRQVRLKIDPNGDRAVSQRQRNLEGGRTKVTPIVDVTGGALAEVLGEGARVRATLSAGEIFFDLHPVDLAIEMREKRARAHVAEGYVTEATLCVGAGVSAMAVQDGIESTGLRSRIDFVVDRELKYLQIAVDNNPAISDETRLYEASLEELDPAALTHVDVLNMSLPCTGHSKAGKSKLKLASAEEHPTDALAVYGALKIIDAVNPSVVVSENLADAKNSASYELLLAYLREQGYLVTDIILDGHQAGTIENRKRWWIVGISRGLADGFSMDSIPMQPRTYASLGEALEDLADDDPRWKAYDYLIDKALRDAAAGKNFKRNLVSAHDTAIGCLTKGHARVRQTDPMITREQDSLTRIFTAKEHARVKGIPESLVKDVPETTAHEVLGQSILYGHAKGIGQAIGMHFQRLAPVTKSSVRQGELAVTTAASDDDTHSQATP